MQADNRKYDKWQIYVKFHKHLKKINEGVLYGVMRQPVTNGHAGDWRRWLCRDVRSEYM